MNTPAIRIPVSIRFHIAAVVAAAALAACATNRAPNAWTARALAAEPPITVGFENEAEHEVDVYLVSDRREWRLGRVAAGARAKLEIPEAAITESPAFVRLAVIEGGPLSVQAAHDPRARFSVAQPVAELRQQRFAYWARPLGDAQLIALRR